LINQIIGAVSISLWAFVTMYILFTILKATMGIRVSVKEELEGLDISEHGTISYPEFGTPVAGEPGERTMMGKTASV
jgi:Amt family ammonium transporter